MSRFVDCKTSTSECRICGRVRPFEKLGPNYRTHLRLLLFTRGVRSPVLLAVFLADLSRPYRCEGCGSTPEGTVRR